MNMWELFREEFKKAFFANNVIYEAKLNFRELKQKGSIRAYVREFTTLTLQIPNLTDEDMLFHFLDGLQSGTGQSWSGDRSGLLMKPSRMPKP